MTAADEWRWTDERGVQRLVRTEELRTALASKVLAGSTLVWRNGMADWLPAESFPELLGGAPDGPESQDDATDVHERPPVHAGPAKAPPATGKAPPPLPKGRKQTLTGVSTEEAARNGAPAPAIAAKQAGPPALPRGPGVPRLPPIETKAATAPTPQASLSDLQWEPEEAETLARGDKPSGAPEPRPGASPNRPILAPRTETLRPANFLAINSEASVRLAPTPSAGPRALEAEAFGTQPAPGARPAGPAPGGSQPALHPRLANPVPSILQPAKDVRAAGALPTGAYPSPGARPASPASGPVGAQPAASARFNPTTTVPMKNQGRAPTLVGVGEGRGRPPLPTIPTSAPPVLARGPQATATVDSREARPKEAAPVAGRPRPPSMPPGRPQEAAREPTRGLPSGAAAALISASAGAGQAGSAPAGGRPSPEPAPRPPALPAGRTMQGLQPEPALAPPREPLPSFADANELLATNATVPEPETTEVLPDVPAPRFPTSRPPTPASRAPLESIHPGLAALTALAEAGQAPPGSEAPPASEDEARSDRPTLPRSDPPPATNLQGQAPATAARPAFPDPVEVQPVLRPSYADGMRLAASLAPAGAGRGSTSRAPPKLAEPVAVPVSSLLGAGGMLIGMVVAAFFVGRFSMATYGAPRLTARNGFGSVATSRARAAVPPAPKPCWVARQPAMWAPLVSKSIPFETVALDTGAIAVAYARDANVAVGFEVNPTTGETTERFSDKVPEDIERVTPTADAMFSVLAPAKDAPLRSVVPVPAVPPFFIGLKGDALVTADKLDQPSGTLWPLAGEEALAAARVKLAGPRGYGLTYRRDGKVWGGWVGADRKPVGSLAAIVGSGGSVGKPRSGWNGRELAVIFADLPPGSHQWEIRVGHAKAGTIPETTTVIPLPKGGPGGDAFAPDIVGLADGRWVLVWTEGPPGSCAVRAQTFDSDFAPVGDPIALSPPAGNYGQAILGASGSYLGSVFLSKGATSYELWGAVLQCG